VDRDPRGLARVIGVIGGGWAGCAAAVALARDGFRVALFEAAAVPGGRARTVIRDGLQLDNGEHLLLGAYRETLALAALLHDEEREPSWRVEPLAIVPLAPTQRHALALRVRDVPASLGLVAGLLAASGLSTRDKIATSLWFARQRRAGFRCSASDSVADALRALPSSVGNALWAPLCLAALNTPPARASAQVFLNVLREAFDGGRHASQLIVPRDGLGAVIPERAVRWLRAHGHDVHLSRKVSIADARDGVRLAHAGGESHVDAAVVAVGPHQLAATFDPTYAAGGTALSAVLRCVEAFSFESITTVYAGYAGGVTLPRGLVRLDDAPGQWVFDRGDILARSTAAPANIATLLSVVISGSGPHDHLSHGDLVTAIDAQLRRLSPHLPALCWSQVIAERRATYACVPGLAHPPCGRVAPHLYLAGDYTYAALPATLEAAVRSGNVAATAVAADMKPTLVSGQ
jgi:squalene-associated FAD-dependent desaturase